MVELQQIGIGHPVVKRVRDIQSNTTPNRDRLFIADGLWAHQVLLDAGTEVETFLWCPEAAYSEVSRRVAERIVSGAHRAYQVSPRTLARIAERDRPDGLVSIARLPRWDPESVASNLPQSALAVVADGIEIPGNLGTLIRTMDGCRADVLVLCNRRTRLTHPKVFRGSHGASLTLPAIEFDGDVEAAEWLTGHGFQVWLAHLGEEAYIYRQASFTGRVAVVVGNERYGVAKYWRERGFHQVMVPMLGKGDSLNVAIAASVILYEVRAQLDSG